jgi:hypothetical protein
VVIKFSTTSLLHSSIYLYLGVVLPSVSLIVSYEIKD